MARVSCRTSPSLPGGRWNEVIRLCGCVASAAGEPIMKKLTCIESHFSSRLPTRVISTGWPATSKRRWSPSFRPRVFMMPTSAETSAAWGWIQRPAASRLWPGIRSV